MSLTSVELNYLIWRYMQESGFDLAAYAFLKDSACLEYEHAENRLIPAIEPGSLVNLVQKGILYTFLEDAADGKKTRLNVLDALLKSKADFDADKDSVLAHAKTTEKIAENGTKSDISANDVNMADSEASDEGLGASKDKSIEELTGIDLPFETTMLTPFTTFAPSILLAWHPSTDVFALGTELLAAVIHALSPAGIAETVTLNHPPVVDFGSTLPSAVSVVLWAPLGAVVLTAGVGGEIRAWAPDGRLKNIVNPSLGAVSTPVQDLLWNPSGLLLLSLDIHDSAAIWEGSTLLLILGVPGTEEGQFETHACWLSELKFALSTRKNAIKIYAVNAALPQGETVAVVGQLQGHDNQICGLAFSRVLKLLALASDADYVIKVWNSLLTQDALELNCAAEKQSGIYYHTLPIIELAWLARAGDLQGNELLSVSMEGAVNIWDAFSGDALVSANIFQNPDNFQISDDESDSDMVMATKNALVFAAAVSADSRFLAVGDDSGNVSVWDINTARYKGTTELLRCLGIFSMAAPELPDFGICDLVWDANGRYIAVCYKGRESVVLQWNKQ
ncbi:transducin (beta)-like 1 [Metschnikowia aff. pulcherrima]|uniref:Transducin (Beta)-like 1 n=1 Tax=Metschnikowia aff. pulcherrima TaxID=2163413 RepID=A0A4P6XRD1_9ASCO|nr:transducin (beta)-like 1 [Metschnikowia aff. pulcherrima]